MIKLPPAPKQPGTRAPLPEWRAHLDQLKAWVHVFEQVQEYARHKRSGGGDAERFVPVRRTKHPFPKNAIQRKHDARRKK